MRGLFFPATGDAREKSSAQETREAEDDGGMSNLTLIYINIFQQIPDSCSNNWRMIFYAKSQSIILDFDII